MEVGDRWVLEAGGRVQLARKRRKEEKERRKVRVTEGEERKEGGIKLLASRRELEGDGKGKVE